MLFDDVARCRLYRSARRSGPDAGPANLPLPFSPRLNAITASESHQEGADPWLAAIQVEVCVRIRTVCSGITGVILVLTIASSAAAQSPAEVAVKGGLNFSNISQDTKFDPADELRTLTGLMAGVSLSRTLRDRIGYQVEALLSQKGNTLFNEADDLDNKLRLTYLEIPVLATYRFDTSNDLTVRIHAGPTFGIKVGQRERNHGEEINDEIELKGSDVGLAVGAEVLRRRLIIGARYTHGLTNIFDDVPGNFSFESMKNRVVSLYVGYALQ